MDELAVSVNFTEPYNNLKEEIFDRMLELNQRVACRAAPPTQVFYAARNILSPSFIVGQIPDLLNHLTSIDTFRRFATLKFGEALELQAHYLSNDRAEGVRLLTANEVCTLRRLLDKKDAQRREYVVLVRSLIPMYIHYLWTAPESRLLTKAFNDFFPGSMEGIDESSNMFFHVDLSEAEKKYFERLKVECWAWMKLVKDWETKRHETSRDEGLSAEEMEKNYRNDFLETFPLPLEPPNAARNVENYIKKVEIIVRKLEELFPPQVSSHPTSSHYSAYSDTIREEAEYLANLGPAAVEDQFHGLYNAILNTWFPASKGYVVDPHVSNDGKPDYVVSCHARGARNPLLIVELKRPSRWDDGGREDVHNQLVCYVEEQFDDTRFNTIYGVGGIGLDGVEDGEEWLKCAHASAGLAGGHHQRRVIRRLQDSS